MSSPNPTDVAVVLEGKTLYLRSTPGAMRGISAACGGYIAAASSLASQSIETALTLLAFGLGRTKPDEVEALNEALFASGGIQEIYPALEEYLIRVFHGGKTIDEMAKDKAANPPKA